MSETLQQKVDRMTPGMDVTVVVDGRSRGTYTVTGRAAPPEWTEGVLFVGGTCVRMYGGKVNPVITDITMLDPECPYSKGDRVLATRGPEGGTTGTATGRMAWCEDHVRWEVEVEGFLDCVYAAEALTLATPEPAEPDCPAILVTYTDGNFKQPEVQARRVTTDGTVYYGHSTLGWWTHDPESTEYGVATVQALRPAEYLRGGA